MRKYFKTLEKLVVAHVVIMAVVSIAKWDNYFIGSLHKWDEVVGTFYFVCMVAYWVYLECNEGKGDEK